MIFLRVFHWRCLRFFENSLLYLLYVYSVYINILNDSKNMIPLFLNVFLKKQQFFSSMKIIELIFCCTLWSTTLFFIQKKTQNKQITQRNNCEMMSNEQWARFWIAYTWVKWCSKSITMHITQHELNTFYFREPQNCSWFHLQKRKKENTTKI